MKDLSKFKKLEPRPKLTLVGAGPGDPELLTLKGLAALKSANAVLYDALIDPVLLDYCDENCEKIYVGKNPGESHSQSNINDLIIEKAYTLGHVVRLKGGDPFVFGRGMEEIEHAKQFGLETEYIPGISSSIAGPGLAGIPLTTRGINEGFWVMTGTKSDGSLSTDLSLGLQSNATLVILMGMGQLSKIEKLVEIFGKENLGAAIIQNASKVNQKIGLGKAGELVKIAEENQLTNPAIIVLGKVVDLVKEEIVEVLVKNKITKN